MTPPNSTSTFASPTKRVVAVLVVGALLSSCAALKKLSDPERSSGQINGAAAASTDVASATPGEQLKALVSTAPAVPSTVPPVPSGVTNAAIPPVGGMSISTPAADGAALASRIQAAAPQPSVAISAQQLALVEATRTYKGAGAIINPRPTPPALVPSVGEESFQLAFEALDIRAIIQSIMGDYLKESFTIHPTTAGTATIRFSRPVPKRDLIPILEMLLRQNGQVMIREEGLYKIMPASLGIRGTITPTAGAITTPLPIGYSVQIIQPKFTGAKDMQRILEPYAIEPATSIRIDELRNLLILSGTQRELRHMLEIIELFDVDFLNGYSIGLFPMSTDVKVLQGDLDRIFGGSTGSPLAGIVKIIPIERVNSLLIISTQSHYLEEAKKWVERLDRSSGTTGGNKLNVYKVQNSKAARLAQLLSEIYGGKGSAGNTPSLAPGARPAQIASTPGVATPVAAPVSQSIVAFAGDGISVSKDVRIIPDTDNNQLLIMASPGDYEKIEFALKQLDVPRRQVLVEVMVASVKLTDDLRFGIEWFISARNGTVGALRNSTGALPTVPAVPTVTGDITRFVDPRSYIPKVGGLQLINVLNNDIRATLQALGTDERVTVVSAPKVMVLDNEKATINVGQKISVETGSSTTGSAGGVLTSRQYLDTGVLLTVTPNISANGQVTMEINQEISSPASTSANPTIDSTKAQTSVTVPSGVSITMAGLISQNKATSSSGIPVLSKIPVIGGLFGAQALTDSRTELIIIITPTVLNNSDDARNVTDELRKKLSLIEPLIQKQIGSIGAQVGK
jgi:general secretion pathway protein D